MKLNKLQLRNIIGVLSEVSNFSVIVKTSNSELMINFNNIAHQTKINDESFSSASEKVENLGRYCLNEFYSKHTTLDIISIVTDNNEIMKEDLTEHFDLLSATLKYIMSKNSETRLLCIMRKGKSRIELNAFDNEYIYRKYVSPDNKSVIMFKNKVEDMSKQLKGYELESINIYKDTLTEKKFRHYQYDASKATGKYTKFVETYKEGSA